MDSATVFNASTPGSQGVESLPPSQPPSSVGAWRGNGRCMEGVWGCSHVGRTTSWYCQAYKGKTVAANCSLLLTSWQTCWPSKAALHGCINLPGPRDVPARSGSQSSRRFLFSGQTGMSLPAASRDVSRSGPDFDAALAALRHRAILLAKNWRRALMSDVVERI